MNCKQENTMKKLMILALSLAFSGMVYAHGSGGPSGGMNGYGGAMNGYGYGTMHNYDNMNGYGSGLMHDYGNMNGSGSGSGMMHGYGNSYRQGMMEDYHKVYGSNPNIMQENGRFQAREDNNNKK